MKKILPVLALSMICASCTDEVSLVDSGAIPVSTFSKKDVPVREVAPEKLVGDADRKLEDFWGKVKEASAARTDAPKRKLTHVVNTTEGPVVVEIEVVMEEYARILEEENNQRAAQKASEEREANSLSASEVESKIENLRSRLRRGDELSRLERDIEASKRRREALEAQLQVERERANRDWVITQIEQDIAAESENESDLQERKQVLDSVERVRVVYPGDGFGGARDTNRVERMPFGGGSFGPWDTGGGSVRP